MTEIHEIKTPLESLKEFVNRKDSTKEQLCKTVQEIIGGKITIEEVEELSLCLNNNIKTRIMSFVLNEVVAWQIIKEDLIKQYPELKD